METIHQRRSSAAAGAITKPPGAMNSAFDTGASDDTKKRRLPPLQLSTLKAESGVPTPTALGRQMKGRTRHDAVFNLLTADGMCVRGIPRAYYGSLGKAAQTYMKARPQLAARSRLLVRTIDASSIGVWREARKAGAA